MTLETFVLNINFRFSQTIIFLKAFNSFFGIAEYSLIYAYRLKIFPIFNYILTPTSSFYCFSKVNFLGPEKQL